MANLTNQLGRTREVNGDEWIHRFANGLVVHTEPFMKSDPQRILPIGGPQDTILNRLVCRPNIVAKKRVFEPFAGSGILGLMALRLGASHVDFLDINPRAAEFQKENAKRNRFPSDRYEAHVGSIEDFEIGERCDLLLANPPFVPVPPGIDGSLTSAAGPEGNDLVAILLRRLDELLSPEGEAQIYVMQLVADDRPLVVQLLDDHIVERTTELTPTQQEPIELQDYGNAYRRCFPEHHEEVGEWERTLRDEHGGDLGVQHYVLHVSATRPGPALWAISDNLVDKYGIDPYPSAANEDLALSRAMENLVPSS